MHQISRKLVLVLAISVPVTDNKSEKVVLEKVPFINYPVWFQESQEQVKTLLDISSNVSAMSPAYAIKLGLKTWKTNIRAQKINDLALEIFGIVIADFQVEYKGDRSRFFQEIFLVTDTKFEVILGMLL